jgi:hypothetical protein
MNIVSMLSSFLEVKDVYSTTGEYNITSKLSLNSIEGPTTSLNQ